MAKRSDSEVIYVKHQITGAVKQMKFGVFQRCPRYAVNSPEGNIMKILPNGGYVEVKKAEFDAMSNESKEIIQKAVKTQKIK